MNPLHSKNGYVKAPLSRKVPIQLPMLQLRTALPISELAEEITYILWNELCREGGCKNLEAHRYPTLLQGLEKVLCQRVNGCATVLGPAHDDIWAHTGGGAPTRAQRLPVCEQHAQRLAVYAGTLLQDLLNAIEKSTRDFLDAHVPPFDSPLSLEEAEHVHHAVETRVKQHLLNNFASPYCDVCEFTRSKIRRSEL